MSLGIPGSRGLFGMLQASLTYTEKGRILINQELRDELADFEYLAKDLNTRPTRIAELVPDHPVAIGPHDASGKGMGGVWLPATVPSRLKPTLWRARFPEQVQLELVSDSNPTGSIEVWLSLDSEIVRCFVASFWQLLQLLGEGSTVRYWEEGCHSKFPSIRRTVYICSI